MEPIQAVHTLKNNLNTLLQISAETWEDLTDFQTCNLQSQVQTVQLHWPKNPRMSSASSVVTIPWTRALPGQSESSLFSFPFLVSSIVKSFKTPSTVLGCFCKNLGFLIPCTLKLGGPRFALLGLFLYIHLLYILYRVLTSIKSIRRLHTCIKMFLGCWKRLWFIWRH